MDFFRNILVGRQETRKDVELAASELHQQALSGNVLAIAEIKKGLGDLRNWKYAGIIEEKDGTFILRTETQLKDSKPQLGQNTEGQIHITKHWKKE